MFNYEILDAGHKVEFELFSGHSENDNKNSIFLQVLETATDHLDFITGHSNIY